MKKIALNACFAVLLVLVVFFVVLAFGVPIELATAATAFVVACATTAVVAGTAKTFATAVFRVAGAFVIVAFVIVTVFGGAFFFAFAVVALATVVATTEYSNLPFWRTAPIYLIEAVTIFWGMSFYRVIGWWSSGIGPVGIVLIIAFWQWCERYDRRHTETVKCVPIVDTLNNDPP